MLRKVRLVWKSMLFLENAACSTLSSTLLPSCDGWVGTRYLRSALLAANGAPVVALDPGCEGLALPGPVCEDLFLTKLPFSPPDDPVGEARAEWLRQVGRDPFTELVVPATAIRLAQWVGRAIRTEEDEAHVTCYDRRLSRTSYGQRLLQGLPPFTRITRGGPSGPARGA